MKKTLFIAMLLCAFSAAALAQAKAMNFSGNWELDAAQSKLGERARVESITMTVVQSAKDIKIDTKTARTPRPATETASAPRPAGFGRGGMFGAGDSTATYSLDGREVTIQQDSPMGQIPVKYSGKRNAGTLNLASSRTFNGPNGETTTTMKESWSLSPDGKTLTVNRESQTPWGTNTSTLVFVKK